MIEKMRNPDGLIESIEPPTAYLTNGVWIYMVPQFKPESVLILGFAGGTVAGLIRLFYGDVPIKGIDILPCQEKYGVKPSQQDAREYIKSCPKFDVCIVDLFDKKICEFVLTDEFAEAVGKICNYIILNTIGDVDVSAYRKRFYKYGSNKPNRLANRIYYFGTKKIIPSPILR